MPSETEHAPMEVPLLTIPSLKESGDINLPSQDDSSGQREEPGLNSSQQNPPVFVHACCCCQNKTSVDKSSDQKTAPKEKLAITVLDAILPRFGPMHGEDIASIKVAKEQAWQHILKKSTEDPLTDLRYLTSISAPLIDKKAKDFYGIHIVNELMKEPNEFEWKMIKDGCFFLQLAIYIVGGGKHLGYPESHPYFGKHKDKTEWMRAMFFAGNQIPYVVIRELMTQSFFKDVIEKGVKEGTWSRRPEELPKLVLYLTVVEPELETSGPNSSGLFSKLMILKKESPCFREPPSDILHGLHCLLLGPRNDSEYSEIRHFQDVEVGRVDDSFPSAEELKISGITLKKSKDGIMKIRFRDFIFFAYLYVPPLTIDGDTEILFKNLMNYERRLAEGDREVTAYLRLMRDLTQTYKDFKILEKRGIIEVKDDRYKNNMVNMLNELVSSQRSNFTPNLRHTRRNVTEYGGPHWRLVSGLVIFLIVVQTIVAIFGYVRRRD